MFRRNPVKPGNPLETVLPSSTGAGTGTVTSVAGGVGITNSPEPITASGTVDLDINSLTTEAAPASGDFLPFLDVSVGSGPSAQRKATLANLMAGAGFQPLDADLTALSALAGTGIAVRTAADTWALRTHQAPAAGLTIANPGGVAGDPTFALANDLAALEALSGTGYARRTGVDAWTLDATATPTAHAILSASHSDVVVATRLRGDLLVANATPAWERLAIGGSATYLRSGGVDPAWSAILAADLPSGIDAAKISSGSVSNAEFDMLDGVTSNIQVQFTGKQPADADLSSIAGMTTSGLVVRAAGTWITRVLTAGAGVIITDGDGFLGDPTVSLDADLTEIAAIANVRGDLLVTDATPAWVRLAIGAANTCLRSDGTDSAWSTGILDNNARVTVRKNTGADVGTRRRLNLIEGTNVTLTVADDAGSEEVDITIASTAGGGSVTSVAGGVGITNTPEPIVGAGTVDLDTFTLTTGTVLSSGDWIPIVDVSVGTTPASQRKITAADFAFGLNTLLDHGALTGLSDDTHAQYTRRAGRGGTANDTTLSTDLSGTFGGSATTLQNLILRANTADVTTGAILLNAPTTHLWPSSPAAMPAVTNLLRFDSAFTSMPSDGIFNLFRFEPVITANNPGLALNGLSVAPSINSTVDPGASGLATVLQLVGLYSSGTAGARPLSVVGAQVRPSANVTANVSGAGVATYTGMTNESLISTGFGGVFSGSTFGLADFPGFSSIFGPLTIPERIGLDFRAPSITEVVGTVTVGENIAVDHADQTRGTTRAAVRSAQSDGVGAWSVFHSGTAPLAHLGAGVFGAATTPSSASVGLEVQSATKALKTSEAARAAITAPKNGMLTTEGGTLYHYANGWHEVGQVERIRRLLALIYLELKSHRLRTTFTDHTVLRDEIREGLRPWAH